MYEKGDLKGSGRSKGESGRPWRGIDPGNRHWAPPKIGSRGEYANYIREHFIPNYGGIKGVHARLDALDNAGLILWPEKKKGVPRLKRYLTDIGQPPQSIIDHIPPVEGDEDLGFKTQKPIALYELFIQASSNRGDVVLDPFCGCATTCIAAEKHQRQWIGIDISHKAIELVKFRLEQEFDLTEHPNLLGKVTHQKSPPQRTDSIEPRQMHFEGLFGVKDASMLGTLSQQELRQFKTHKHVLFGMQEGKCAGCQAPLYFRNMTIDHIKPRSQDGSDHITNLQLLCGACNSTKGDRTQSYLVGRLKEKGILR